MRVKGDAVSDRAGTTGTNQDCSASWDKSPALQHFQDKGKYLPVTAVELNECAPEGRDCSSVRMVVLKVLFSLSRRNSAQFGSYLKALRDAWLEKPNSF